MTKKYDKLVTNALGRIVPEVINGQVAVPFMGIGKYKPAGHRYGPAISSCADYPADGNKLVASLRDALELCSKRSQ
jgi:citrate lyase subunit alpha/citrate CoA-transferase